MKIRPMHRDADHPDYDPAMEMLICLPKRPHGARLVDVARNLGMNPSGSSSEAVMRRLMEQLRERGIHIRESRCPVKGRLVGIPPESWEMAQSMGESYHERVYGREVVA